MPDWQDKLAEISRRNRQEIVHAKLSKREMMRLGLLTSSGTLALKLGLSARALAQSSGAPTPASPATRPWVAPLPIIPIKQTVAGNDPRKMTGGAPDGTTPIDGATKRINHQFCTATTDDHGGYTYGGRFAPRKFYETFMKASTAKFHPDYAPTKFWGFDGIYPGPRYVAYYGEPVMVRFHNQLPSKTVYKGFGIPEMSTHLHNGHTPSESDGNPVNYFNSSNDSNEINPQGFKDQHYPNVYAGFTSRGDNRGDPAEALSSLWYHDHHLDFTAQNVVKGMVGVYTLFDDRDTGDENTGLRLPSGEFDVPMMFGDFIFDKNCQMVYDLFNSDGILGDKFCVNGAIQPYFNVRNRRYRLRLYNHGPARWYEYALFDGTNYLPFWQISNDGNLLPKALQRTSVRLAVAERADIIVDFSKINASRLYLVNRLEQTDGRGPNGNILSPGTPLMQINIDKSRAVQDPSFDFSKSTQVLRELPDPDFAKLMQRAAKAKTRTFRFERSNGAWAVNGKLFDQDQVAARIDQESEEVWIIQNTGGAWRHPVHIHFEEHRVLSRNGVATATNSTEYARKDVIPLNWNEEVKIFMRFRDMKGRYVTHCHNVMHEDSGMMFRWDIV
jgi:FtsP/CotA-like multicopper oxidase with cupredoxin domain